jgi:hypothetical protein
LGYSWINGVLQQAGFFTPAAKPGEKDTGIWLAGDYSNQWPTVNIQSVNDGLVKQVTNCLDMARLFVLMYDHDLVRDDHPGHNDSNDQMKILLGMAVDDKGAASLLKRIFTFCGKALPFEVLQSKIGVGPLNGGSCPWDDHPGNRCTYSEAAIVKHSSSGCKFVVVWQNLVLLKDTPGSWCDGLSRIVNVIAKTMDAYCRKP